MADHSRNRCRRSSTSSRLPRYEAAGSDFLFPQAQAPSVEDAEYTARAERRAAARAHAGDSSYNTYQPPPSYSHHHSRYGPRSSTYDEYLAGDARRTAARAQARESFSPSDVESASSSRARQPSPSLASSGHRYAAMRAASNAFESGNYYDYPSSNTSRSTTSMPRSSSGRYSSHDTLSSGLDRLSLLRDSLARPEHHRRFSNPFTPRTPPSIYLRSESDGNDISRPSLPPSSIGSLGRHGSTGGSEDSRRSSSMADGRYRHYRYEEDYPYGYRY
ncbi:hypothetical protein LTR56_021851 [Elasticomyces elasticus]|nr:hypothetical protein LTR56_021851 [Elasticomyces elasticus]KAK3641652.1 hypothetical protein LTR22_016470 [Elasticomyces elasticus]KAK4906061.1 hypothetical protein LTR49_024725 [Elasticomyces elasticus]KAK5743714.1 hypothetical protein LTS12_023751 [Elasticomyces elasticus]